MKKRKYFVSYSHKNGFGEIIVEADEITKETVEEWINQMTEKITKMSHKFETCDVVILNFKEIK